MSIIFLCIENLLKQDYSVFLKFSLRAIMVSVIILNSRCVQSERILVAILSNDDLDFAKLSQSRSSTVTSKALAMLTMVGRLNFVAPRSI